MAVIKCKMCGGDLNIVEDSPVAECEYCGAKQTVPNQDDEKKLALFARAERLRRNCEFDKAAGVYESIVADFPEEAEAYWGLVLCRYGIEYVDSPATGKKVPTCHRSSFDSILEDSDFDQACENADPVARRVYREEAKAIEELRKGILEVSGKEEPYDIFICYKETDESGQRTIDSVIAQDVYDALTEKGYRVFFSRVSLEDKLGTEYEPYIFAALNSAKVMLAFGTDYEHFNAVWVKNEWSRFLALIAAGQKKTLIPCYKGIDAYDMPKEFAKLQAQDMGKVGAIQDLLRGVGKVIPRERAPMGQSTVQSVIASGGPNIVALLKRGQMALTDGNWDGAKDHYDQVLNMDAESAEAYLGLAMSEHKDATREDCERSFMDGKYDDDKSFLRAKQFSEGDLKRWFDKLEEMQQARKKAQEAFCARMEQLWATLNQEHLLSAGFQHTIGLKVDGTVVAVGKNLDGRCDVGGWSGIVSVSAGGSHTVGLKTNGTVVAVGSNEYDQCDVSDWRDIVAVSAGRNHTVGLKKDGTVVAVGDNSDGRCDVGGWSGIVSVSAGGSHTVGLKVNGTVVAVGDNSDGQCGVTGWRDIVALSAGRYHTVGLKKDGKVVAVGWNGGRGEGRCEVSTWRDIVAVSAGRDHTVGLKKDGTVVAVGDNSDGRCEVTGWHGIVAVITEDNATIGLKTDGTVVAAGPCGEASGWKLFDDLEELEQRCAESTRRWEEMRRCVEERNRRCEEVERTQRIAMLTKEKSALQTELASLKGLFAGRRRKQIEARLAEIETKLKNHDWS